VNVDYQKKIKQSSYKFLPIHLQWSGLHVPASAILFYVVFCRLPDGKAPINVFLCIIIGLVVFSVNNMSGFLNTGKPGQVSHAKHVFLKKHRAIFSKVIAVCLLLSAILSCFIPSHLWKFGAGICLLTAICLCGGYKIPLQNSKQALMEPFIAILYALGVWGCALVSSDFENLESNITGLVFFLLTLQITLLLSHFEALDRNTKPGLARWLGKPRTRFVMYIVTILVGIICTALCLKTEFRYVQRVSVIFMLITFFQLSIFIKSSKVEKRVHLWMAAEFSVLLPLLLL